MSNTDSIRPKVWVCGEALIDLVPDGANEFKAIVGGGPANAAKALANLGIETYFIGGLSSDGYGAEIERELVEGRIDLSLVHRSAAPTATARVSLSEDGVATYEFSLSDTATFEFSADWLPSGKPSALYIGSLATALAPSSNELYSWASSLDTAIFFDPNVRPSVIADPKMYLAKIQPWLAISKIVKFSQEDLEFIYREELASSGEGNFIDSLLDSGPEMIVLTRGSEGLSGYTKAGAVHVAAEEIALVDTIGAGDTVGAILVEGLILHGIEGLVGPELEQVLRRASRAAGITCSRAGAKPPQLGEL